MRALARRPAYVVLAVAYPVLLAVGTATGQSFFADEWEYIVRRNRPAWGDLGGWADLLLRPHNEHWTTVPIVVFRSVFGVVGLRAYWPYLAVSLAVHLITCVLLARRLEREGVNRWIVVVAATVLAFYGAGSENIWWAFQIAFVGSVAFGLAWLERIDQSCSSGAGQSDAMPPPYKADRWGWLLGIGALACSGVGVAFVVAAGATALLRRGWRAALATVWVPLAAYAVWYGGWGRTREGSTPIDWSYMPFNVVPFVWRAVTATVEGTIGFGGVGALAVSATIAGVALRWPELARRHAAPLAMAGGLVAFLLLVAIGRVTLDQPNAERYLYVSFALLAPLWCVLIDRLLAAAPMPAPALAASLPARRAAAAVLGGASIVYSFGFLMDQAAFDGDVERETADRLRAAFVVARSGRAAPEVPVEGNAAYLTVEEVQKLLSRGEVLRGQPSADALAGVLGRTAVDVTGRPRVPLQRDAVSIAALGRVEGAAIESGCIGLSPVAEKPQIAFVPHRAASIKVVPLVGGQVLLYVRREDRTSDPLPVKVAANNPVFVNVSDPRIQLIVEIPPEGITKMCGVGQDLPR